MLLNIAGIVFFILFLNSGGKLRSVKKEKVALERQLAVMRSATVMGDAVLSDKILRRTFASHADGQMDTYVFTPPAFVAGSSDYTLVVYLHGMGSNDLEPFVTPNEQTIADGLTKKDGSLGILSCNYRKEASWGSDAAVADIAQTIRLVMQEFPFKRIVMMGSSMGACVALNFAATAPADIQSKIVGVVAIEGAGDLAKLYYETANKGIAPSMIVSFGGRPDMIPDVYKQKSFLFNLSKAPAAMRFYLLGAREDRIVPFSFQQELQRQLEDADRPVKLEVIDGGHCTPPCKFYCEGVEFALGRSGD